MKLTAIPFFRSLDFSFFVRFAAFSCAIYYINLRLKTFHEEKVICEQPDSDSPTRFSKTFGQENKLDDILKKT
jgi:hypothetical protein